MFRLSIATPFGSPRAQGVPAERSERGNQVDDCAAWKGCSGVTSPYDIKPSYPGLDTDSKGHFMPEHPLLRRTSHRLGSPARSAPQGNRSCSAGGFKL
jgi:hypothetical protein